MFYAERRAHSNNDDRSYWVSGGISVNYGHQSPLKEPSFHNPRRGLFSKWTSFSICVLLTLGISSVATGALFTSCPAQSASMAGNITLSGLFDLHDADGDTCGTVSVSTVMEVEAILWTLRNINDMDYIPGVKIGMSYRDTCGQPDLAMSSLRKLLPVHQYDQQTACTGQVNVVYAGILGPSRSGPAQAVSQSLDHRPDNQHYLQISYSVTASKFSHPEEYPNFVRVIPSDKVQIEVIVQLLRKLEWNAIVVMYSDETYGRGGIRDLKTAFAADITNRVCIYDQMAISVTTSDQAGTDISNFLRSVVDGGNHIHGIIYFGQKEQAKRVLDIANSNHNADTFSFIFSETSTLLQVNLYKYKEIALGLLTSVPATKSPNAFQKHWENLFTNFTTLRRYAIANPWLEEVLMDTGNCFLRDTVRLYPQFAGKTLCTEFTPEMVRLRLNESPYLVYAIHAAQLYSYLIKQVYNGPCRANLDLCVNVMASEVIKAAKDPNLSLDISNEFSANIGLTNLLYERIELDENGDMNRRINKNVLYDVLNYVKNNGGQALIKIARYIQTSLTFDSPIKMYGRNGELSNLPKSHCEHSCDVCLVRPLAEEILVSPGDYYIVASVPVYEPTDDPFICGDIRRTSGADLAEAFLFALKQFNSRARTILPGKKVGLILFNSCRNPVHIQQLVATLSRGNTPLPGIPDGSYANRILGYIGSYSSSTTVELAKTVAGINSVLVSYASTSPALSDRTVYPTFMRTAPSDDRQIQAMIALLLHFKWRFISLIYNDDNYGINAKRVLEEQARNYNICIAVELAMNKETNPARLLTELRLHSDATVVIIIVESESARKIIETFDRKLESANEFIFIGSEAWGNTKTITSGTRNLIGSYTLAIESQKIDQFNTHMAERMGTGNIDNPWLVPFWQRVHTCNVPSSFHKPYSVSCRPDLTLNPTYEQDIWVPFVVEAVIALSGRALKTIREVCFGGDGDGICEEYHSKAGVNILYNNILTYESCDALGHCRRIFDDDGNGNRGYTIYRIEPSANRDHEYVKVATWAEGTTLEFEDKYKTLNLASTECRTPQDCAKCPSSNATTDTLCGTDADDSWKIAAIVLIVLLLLIVCLLVGLLIYCGIFRKKKVPEESQKTPSPRDYTNVTYTTPCDINVGPVDGEVDNEGFDDIRIDYIKPCGNKYDKVDFKSRSLSNSDRGDNARIAGYDGMIYHPSSVASDQVFYQEENDRHAHSVYPPSSVDSDRSRAKPSDSINSRSVHSQHSTISDHSYPSDHGPGYKTSANDFAPPPRQMPSANTNIPSPSSDYIRYKPPSPPTRDSNEHHHSRARTSDRERHSPESSRDTSQGELRRFQTSDQLSGGFPPYHVDEGSWSYEVSDEPVDMRVMPSTESGYQSSTAGDNDRHTTPKQVFSARSDSPICQKSPESSI